jgi:phage terminase small subunit
MGADIVPPKPPSGLAATGRALWLAVCEDAPAELEFDSRELAILEAACRQADAVAALERAIKRDGAMITGAAGQRRLNGAVTEARQGRIALTRLLGELRVPDEAEEPRTAASKRGAHAAKVRWDLDAHRERRRHASS